MATEKKQQQEMEEEQQTTMSKAKVKATILVHNLIPIVLSVDHDDVSLGMNIDAMIKQFEKLFIKQQEFAGKRKPTLVNIGFHWTKSYYVESIRCHSLLTKKELSDRGIRVNNHVPSMYDGVQTADDPIYACRDYGESCFLVARLPGEPNITVACGSVIKLLKSSEQCVPLMCFGRKLVIHDRTKIFQCHLELQTLLDGFFNEGREGTVVRCSWLQGRKFEYMCQRLQDLPHDPIGFFAKPGKANPFLKRKSKKTKQKEGAQN